VRQLGPTVDYGKENVLDELDDLLVRLEGIILDARSDPNRSIGILPGAT